MYASSCAAGVVRDGNASELSVVLVCLCAAGDGRCHRDLFLAAHSIVDVDAVLY